MAGAARIAEFFASVGFQADEKSLKSALTKVAAFGASVSVLAAASSRRLWASPKPKPTSPRRPTSSALLRNALRNCGMSPNRRLERRQAHGRARIHRLEESPHQRHGRRLRSGFRPYAGHVRAAKKTLRATAWHRSDAHSHDDGRRGRAPGGIPGHVRRGRDGCEGRRRRVEGLFERACQAEDAFRDAGQGRGARLHRQDPARHRKPAPGHHGELWEDPAHPANRDRFCHARSRGDGAFVYRIIKWAGQLVGWFDSLDDGQKKHCYRRGVAHCGVARC